LSIAVSVTPPSVVADVRALEASRGVAAWRSPLSLVGLAAVAAARLLTLPASIWEYDEVLFVRGVESFEPLAHRPHPPGYPLLVGLGKMAAAILGDPFRGLVALSVLASLVGYLALVDTFARIAPGDRESREARWAGVAGAVLFALSPPMLVYGPLALSEAPALAFVALALAAGARLVERPSSVVAATCGAFATAAVGCRPQLIVAVAPMLAVIVVLVAIRARRGDGNGAQGTPVMPTGRATRRGDELRAPGIAAALAPLIALGVGFAAVTAAWLVPLVNATGGVSKLRLLLGSQANLVAANDASIARVGIGAGGVLARFVADPWGPRWAAIAIGVLALAGALRLARARRAAALPLLVFAAVDFAFALAVMNPGDAARYALPSMLAVAFLAGCGCASLSRWRVAAPAALLVPAILVIGFAAYCAPLLRVRATTPSPPVQAAAWAREHVPAGALVLYERELASHALELLPSWKGLPADARIRCSPKRPVFLLAEGPSGGAGGATFAWPEGEAWRTLTRGHLGVVSWTPVSAAKLYEPLAGVHGPEPSALAWLAGRDGDSWRWLSDRASLRLSPGGAATLDLGLRLPTNVPYTDVTVTLDVAGVRQPPLHLARGESASLRVSLPAARRVRVDFASDRSFLPADAGITSGDRRRLAVQLVHLELVDFPPHDVGGPGSEVR